jgi:uncharacterized membrane protein YbhN (UPF0104 family)
VAHVKRVALIGMRVAVFAAAAWFLARGVRWADVAASLAHASVPLLVIVVLLNFGKIALQAARLRLLLRPAETSVAACARVLLASSALNNVTPLRGGDVARVWMLEREAGVTKRGAVLLAIVEKLLELGALGALGVISAFALDGQDWARVAAPIVVVASAIGLAIVRRRAVIGPLALSFAAWAIEIAMLLVCARALGAPMTPALAAVTLLGLNLAIALPSAPASAGPYESAMVVVLTLAGAAKADALGFALLYHAVQVVPVSIVGIVAFSSGRRARSETTSDAPRDSACT